MLEVGKLTVTYPGSVTPAVDGLDLEVEAGEVVAVLGPSGCGKSTLLRAVAGLIAPSSGRIILAGRDLSGVEPHRRGVGLMFQDYALFPHRDVADNIAFGLRMRGDGKGSRRARVAELLELVGLSGAERRAVSTLSGGERQRVALARALAPSPSLVMLDEPLGALDRTLRDRLVLELGEMFAAVGVAVIYVTHDQAEAFAVGDRVMVMQAGRPAQLGAPAEVWARPATAFVARFLGFTNIFEADVTDAVALTRLGPCPVGGAPDGPATLLVRPEAVSFGDGAHRPGSVDWGVALVREVVFHGGSWRVMLARGASDIEATARNLPGEGPEPATTVPVAIGAEVAVRVDPAGVQVLG